MTEENQAKRTAVRRFSTYRIIEHLMLIAFVSVLASTGLAQKFYTLGFSEWIIHNAGGIDNLRLAHRYTGLIFSIFISVHIVSAMAAVSLRRWEPSMVITPKDFADLVENIRYYVGMSPRPAFCDRFSYRQKFDYWAVILSVVIMAASGAVLIFPAFFTTFLPGETVPLAKVLHTNQALVILLIISVWHIYNAIFSPEVFPLDMCIFTGYISKERMLIQHPLEFERTIGERAEHSPESARDETGAREGPAGN